VRHKPIHHVLEEVIALERLGLEHIFFTDDDFAADSEYAKELLQQLAPLNRSFGKPIRFSAQVSISLAKDEEMLELITDANFLSLFMGIEIPPGSQKARKPEADAVLLPLEKEKLSYSPFVKGDGGIFPDSSCTLIAACKKIMSYGLLIRAALTVGFDHDTPETFDAQFEFVQEAGIPFPSPSMLRVVPGTELWRQFHREGRCLEIDEDNIYALRMATTNIIPKQMTRRELMSGYMNLIERLADWDNFVERVKVFLSGIDPESDKIPRIRYWTQAEIDNAMRALLAFVDDEARRAISSLLSYASEHIPFMMERLLGIVAQGYGYVAFVQSLRETIRKRMDMEESMDMEQFIDKDTILIPEGFEEHYYDIFPQVFDRLHQGLTDKTRIYDALIEIFTGFLSHFQKKADIFSEHRMEFLHEFTDRIIVRKNNALGEPSSVFAQSDLAAPGAKREVADEILKAVEQELRSQHPLHRGKSAAAQVS